MAEHPYGWLSLLPPIVAIVLAILTRKILLSLLVSIFVGALVLGYYAIPEAGPNAVSPWAMVQQAAVSAWHDHLWPTLLNPDKVSVFVFTCLMGAIVGMVNRAAGMRGLLDLMSPIARSVPGLQISTWCSGMLVFFDDYANTMLLGTTYRSAYDRLKISREKLAYIVDSTAAPVAGLAIVSTWIAGELDYINQGLASTVMVESAGGSAFQLFLASIPYRFYVLWALFFVLVSAVLGRDFGPMWAAERRARQMERDATVEDYALPDDLDWQKLPVSPEVIPIDMTEVLAVAHDPTLAPQRTPARSWNAILPIAVTVVAILGLMYQTGLANQPPPVLAESDAGAPAETGRSIQQWGEIFGNADSYGSLVWGSVIGLLFTWFWLTWQRIVPATILVQAAGRGATQMVPALAILWLASTLSIMTSGSPSEPYQRELDRATAIAQAIAGIERVESSFLPADRLTRVQDTLRLHQVPDGVIVETLVGQYGDPKEFFNQVLSRISDPRVDAQFYSRYLVLGGQQVDWDRFMGSIPKRVRDDAATPTDAPAGTPTDHAAGPDALDQDSPAPLPTGLPVNTPQETAVGQGAAAEQGPEPAPLVAAPGQLMYQGARADPSMDGVWQSVDDPLSFPYTDIGRRLHTGRYLSGLLSRLVGPVEPAAGEIAQHPFAKWLPTLVFVLAGFTAFATGTSWGTMGIIMPLAIPLAGSLLNVSGGPVDPNAPIFLATIAGVLAGAIFGDHCSPISDTTVLSSNASGCPHLAHVWTQMPYALTVAAVTIVFGTLPVGFGLLPWWICLPLGTVVLVLIMWLVGRPVELPAGSRPAAERLADDPGGPSAEGLPEDSGFGSGPQ
jgi:Na+/H+ antiporter NhaC